jgi:hypothetical protein
MDLPIQPMSLLEYANIHAQLGAKLICHNGVFWRRVRPLFYRPLLPVEAVQLSAAVSPVTWPSGFQYVVTDLALANSTMNFLMLFDLPSYSLGELTHKRRQLIHRASRQFHVRLIHDPRELQQHGHRIYLSFYERTHYPYKSDRRTKTTFDQWVTTLFSNPKTILLGGFSADGMEAYMVSYCVNQTLVCSTLVCESAAMHNKLGELMFHEMRLLASQLPGIKEIFVRTYQGGNSLDQYYLLRGCQLVRKPARMVIYSPIQLFLRRFMPKKYELLCGAD